jgi:hypothetical protein
MCLIAPPIFFPFGKLLVNEALRAVLPMDESE